MKYWFRYLAIFGSGILFFVLLISAAKSPENRIEGEWSELTWEYEKVEKKETPDSDFLEDSNYVKSTIGHDLVIHKAEKWRFYPNGKLILQGKEYTKEVSWCMKGRGNILELKYGDNNVEHYSLTELSDNKMVLNFDTETHTRGIARLTFDKIN
jgi:hypothetical protein